MAEKIATFKDLGGTSLQCIKASALPYNNYELKVLYAATYVRDRLVPLAYLLQIQESTIVWENPQIPEGQYIYLLPIGFTPTSRPETGGTPFLKPGSGGGFDGAYERVPVSLAETNLLDYHCVGPYLSNRSDTFDNWMTHYMIVRDGNGNQLIIYLRRGFSVWTCDYEHGSSWTWSLIGHYPGVKSTSTVRIPSTFFRRNDYYYYLFYNKFRINGNQSHLIELPSLTVRNNLFKIHLLFNKIASTLFEAFKIICHGTEVMYSQFNVLLLYSYNVNTLDVGIKRETFENGTSTGQYLMGSYSLQYNNSSNFILFTLLINNGEIYAISNGIEKKLNMDSILDYKFEKILLGSQTRFIDSIEWGPYLYTPAVRRMHNFSGMDTLVLRNEYNRSDYTSTDGDIPLDYAYIDTTYCSTLYS